MKYRTFGRLGWKVSEIGFGAWAIGGSWGTQRDDESVAALNKAHPDVRCWTAAIDSHLNEVGYIIPGLGDAGDKIFGTK